MKIQCVCSKAMIKMHSGMENECERFNFINLWDHRQMSQGQINGTSESNSKIFLEKSGNSFRIHFYPFVIDWYVIFDFTAVIIYWLKGEKILFLLKIDSKFKFKFSYNFHDRF